ncbi:MAG: dephospho-CoA kinase [bacterium]
MIRIIGVTGGVGSGKSEILSFLKENYNCRILKSDDAARDLEKKGQACYGPVVSILEDHPTGRPLLDEDGEIIAGEMAARIFEDRNLLAKINQVVHPAVIQYIMDTIAKERQENLHDYFFLEAALLIETGFLEVVDSMWYIYCDEKERRRRLKASRGYSDEKIDRIMAAQLSDEKFRESCDTVIDNSGSLAFSEEQIRKALST